MRELLVVEDDPREQTSVVELLGHDDVNITTAGTGAEALSLLRSRPFDCVVLDLKLPDMSGFDLLTEIQGEESLKDMPIVVFTGRELTAEEEAELRKKAKSIVVKGVRSPERLLDETALFLHRVVEKLPPAKQRMLESLHDTRRGAARPEGAGGRRRRAEHLRAVEPARAPRHGGRRARRRARRRSTRSRRSPTCRSC